MLTPEQAQDLVEYFGGKRTAAREIGVHRNTFSYWLDPEVWKRRTRARYQRDPETRRAQLREQYHSESGLQRAQRQLRMRRTKALIRRADRESRRTT